MKFHGSAPPSPLLLSKYLEERSALLQQSFVLALSETVTGERKEFTIVLKDRPDWVMLDETGFHATIDPRKVEEFLETEVRPLLPEPSTAVLIAPPAGEEHRALVQGIARDGYLMDAEETTERILAALQEARSNLPPSLLQSFGRAGSRPSGGEVRPQGEVDQSFPIDIALEKVEGRVVDASGLIPDLQLLSQGRSRFTGSPAARIANIQKAVEEHLNNSYVPAGELFSYLNAVGPMTQSRGWRLALGIFNGQDLAPTPGGGVCQVSTTAYRAMLGAGLPITKQFNHSIYVGYYAAYGDGLDATVFGNGYEDSEGLPGGKDLVFINDTDSPILIQATVEGDEVIVNILGRPDGRRVSLEGPYRRHEAPAELIAMYGKELPSNSISWLQRVVRSDGTVEEKVLISRYNKEIPVVTPKGKEPLRLAGYHAASNL